MMIVESAARTAIMVAGDKAAHRKQQLLSQGGSRRSGVDAICRVRKAP